MRGTPLNLPKWLLLLVVFGVFIGQAHQLVCKAGAHENEAPTKLTEIVTGVESGLGGDADDMSDLGCAFQCPFHCSVLAVFTSCALPGLALGSELLGEQPQDSATSRAGSIDLPPQIA